MPRVSKKSKSKFKTLRRKPRTKKTTLVGKKTRRVSLKVVSKFVAKDTSPVTKFSKSQNLNDGIERSRTRIFKFQKWTITLVSTRSPISDTRKNKKTIPNLEIYIVKYFCNTENI